MKALFLIGLLVFSEVLAEEDDSRLSSPPRLPPRSHRGQVVSRALGPSNDFGFPADPDRRITEQPRIIYPIADTVPTTANSIIESCKRACPVTAEYNPVCGTDKKTYLNIGLLECARTCGVNVQLKRKSPCGKANNSRKRRDFSYAIENCVMGCASETSEYNPVCGTDYVTYANLGRLQCAQRCGLPVSILRHSSCSTTFNWNDGVEVCISTCKETSEYSPVCGSDNRTYKNEVMFQCAKDCGRNMQIIRRTSCSVPDTTNPWGPTAPSSNKPINPWGPTTPSSFDPWGLITPSPSKPIDPWGPTTPSSFDPWGLITPSPSKPINPWEITTPSPNGNGNCNGNSNGNCNGPTTPSSFDPWGLTTPSPSKPINPWGITTPSPNGNGNCNGNSNGNCNGRDSNSSGSTSSPNGSGGGTNGGGSNGGASNGGGSNGSGSNGGGSNGGGSGTKTPSIKEIISCMQLCHNTPEVNPVCGTDGVTYSNAGQLLCAQSCGVDVKVRMFAPCPGSQLRPSQTPTPTPTPALTSTSTPTPTSTEATKPPSIQDCVNKCLVSIEFKPVCGTDGVMYINIESLRCKINCEGAVSVLKEAPCGFPILPTAVVSPSQPTVTTGAPTPQPSNHEACVNMCTQSQMVNGPVCGTDGVTYPNLAAFQCAKRCGINIQIRSQSTCASGAKDETTTPTVLGFTIPSTLLTSVFTYYKPTSITPTTTPVDDSAQESSDELAKKIDVRYGLPGSAKA